MFKYELSSLEIKRNDYSKLENKVEIHIDIETDDSYYFLRYLLPEFKVSQRPREESLNLIKLLGKEEAEQLFEKIKKDTKIEELYEHYENHNLFGWMFDTFKQPRRKKK
jgi:hypothetical protein